MKIKKQLAVIAATLVGASMLAVPAGAVYQDQAVSSIEVKFDIAGFSGDSLDVAIYVVYVDAQEEWIGNEEPRTTVTVDKDGSYSLRVEDLGATTIKNFFIRYADKADIDKGVGATGTITNIIINDVDLGAPTVGVAAEPVVFVEKKGFDIAIANPWLGFEDGAKVASGNGGKLTYIGDNEDLLFQVDVVEETTAAPETQTPEATTAQTNAPVTTATDAAADASSPNTAWIYGVVLAGVAIVIAIAVGTSRKKK